MNADSSEKSASLRILMLEDNPGDAALVLRRLNAAGLQVETDEVRTSSDFMEHLRAKSYDVILCDFSLPGWDGLEALRWVRRSGYNTPFIYVSGTLGEDIAVECIKEGATDYVLKNNLARLPHAVRRALDERDLQLQNKRSEEEYRLLFENNPGPTWVFDPKSLAFLAVNEAAIRLYGYSREEFLKMSVLDLRSSEDVDRILNVALPEPSLGVQEERNWRHRAKNGSLIDVELSSHGVSFRGIDARLVLARDVTEVKKGQEKLQQSEERFSKAFQSSPVAITISTRDEGRYVDVNDTFLRMIGRQRHEVIGRTTLDLNIWDIPRDRARMIEELDRVGRVSALETVFISKSRESRKVELTAELIQLEGTTCVLAITNDVTDARSLEEQFRQAQKMEAVGRIAGGVAHDFANMLGVIIGYCDLAQGRGTFELALRDIQQSKKAAQRAAALTRQLLAFSRRQVLQPRVVNLNDVVKDISQMLLRVIAEDISLAFVPAPSLGTVKADLGQIEQVLMNLVMNARDAMPRGGKVVIETANVELDEIYCNSHPEVKPGAYVLLSVSDTGSGIDPENISRIFEPFFTTKPPGEGTGLGLSMVYGVIRQSGGHIWAYSEPGQGTVFKIYLPRTDEAAEPLSRTTPEIVFAKGSETVLLVEDDQNLRELTTELMESEGYRVLAAKDGPSAIVISQRQREAIHILLTDVVLPNMSGTVLAGRIKNLRPDLKVLYMSGYTGNLVAPQGMLASDAAFIQKPFTKHGLLSELRRVLDQ
jgi:two-component system, cell cycle sensor histidine kinase and response regulator CckA